MTGLTLCLVLFAATFHAAWNFAAKKVSGNPAVLWLGLCVASVLSWPLAIGVYRAGEITRDNLAFILATGTLHAAYFGLIMKAYQRGDISLVYPVARGTGVAGTALLASVWLREAVAPIGIAGIMSICLGTALLSSGQRRHYEGAPAYCYALAVGLTITLYSVVDKLGVATIHPIVYISSMSTLTALILLPYMGWQRWDGCREAWTHKKVYIGIIGVGSIGTYLLILFAYRLGPASSIVAVREFAVVIGALLGVMFLHERVTLKKVGGMMAIMCGIIMVKTA